MPVKSLPVKVSGQGFYDVSQAAQAMVHDTGILEGLCTLFIQHTSASLVIQENADPAVRHDLQRWMNRLVPENDRLYTHTTEGSDDMPAHIKCALTATSLSIPILNGRLVLGIWQGIYLWEHRVHAGQRSIIVHIAGDVNPAL